MIGKTISHYEIVEKLGIGGMGVVYKAQDTKLKRTVALKFLPPQLSSDPETKERFIHEAQAASALDHPNICTIHEIGETNDGESYIAMACYDGQSLKQLMQSNVGATGSVAQPMDQSIHIAIQIAKGLQKAHEKGIVHRDIKPANIMITDDGTVKILDFGLAKLAGQTRLTKTGSTVGTAAYMSPEQAKGEMVDQRTDIWSLGVVMYEMLTGKIPFGGDYEQAMIYSIINEEPLQISVLNEDVSAELEEIVHKCLAKDVNERYQIVDDLLADFKGFSKELDISFDESLPKLLQRVWRKKIVRRLSAVAATLTLVTVAGFLFWPTMVEPTPIVIISFENQTGESKYDILSKVIPDLLITNLEQSGRFHVVTWQRLHDLLKQLDKDSVEFISSELGFEICRLEGVPNIIVGSIAKIGDIFATDLKVLDVKTKEILQTAQAKGNGENSILETQIDELTREVATEFGELTEEKFVQTHRAIIDVATESLEAYKYYLMGRENSDAVNWKEARENFSKAVHLDSTFVQAHIGLANAFLQGEFQKEKEKHLEMAKKYRNKLTHKEQILFDYGYAVLNYMDLSKSIRELKKATSLYPKEKGIYSHLGYYYWYVKGEFDSAIVAYNKVLELVPDNRWTLNKMGYLYSEKKDYTKSFEYLQRYAEIAPNEHNPYDTMGDVYLSNNEYKRSIEMYERALKIKPDLGSSHAGIASNLIKMRDYQNAIDRLDQWSEIASSNWDQIMLNEILSTLYIAEGDLERTLKVMDRSDSLYMQMSDTSMLALNQFSIAEILFENGIIKEAEEKLERGKKLMESSRLSEGDRDLLLLNYLSQATCLEIKKGNMDRAKEYFKMYKKNVDKNLEFSFKRGFVWEKRVFTLSGLIANAEKNYEKAISDLIQSEQNDGPFTNYYLALAYLKNGNKTMGVEKLERVVNYFGLPDLTGEIYRDRAEKQLSLLKAGE